MLDWSKIVGFDWDDGNACKSADKHGVSQGEAEQIFSNEALIVAFDRRHSETETRFHALGRTSVGRLLHITFTLREADTLIRVISARGMSKKEKVIYDQGA